MAIDSTIKREVAKEWIQFFPELYLVTFQKLYKILGNSIVGIYIGSKSEWYTPYFVVHPLYGHTAGTDLKSILSGFPVMLDTGTGSSLKNYIEPEEKYKLRDKEEFKTAFGVFLQGDISLSKFLGCIDQQLFSEVPGYARGDFVSLHLLKIFTALYAGNKVLAQELCNNLTDEEVKWRKEYLSEWYAVLNDPFYSVPNFEAFRANIQGVIDNPVSMLATIEVNKNDPKLKKLKKSEILLE